MTAIDAMFYREAKIRATNLIFIFWDVFYPLAYMLVFGVGVNAALGSPLARQGVDYNAFFLASVLGMAGMPSTAAMPASAQGRNLLQNPGFEGDYKIQCSFPGGKP